MSTDIKTIRSSIKLQDNSTSNISTITVEESDTVTDFSIKIPTTTNYFVSKKRLSTAISKVGGFLNNPTISSAIATPGIVDITTEGKTINIKATNFRSDAVLKYACTRVQISNDINFVNNGTATDSVDEYIHNFDDITTIKLTCDNLLHGRKYYVRISHGASGLSSSWSEPRAFTINYPTLETPVINSANVTYAAVKPFTPTLTVTSSPFVPLDVKYTHQSSNWKIYRKEGDSYVQIFDSGDDTSNLTSFTNTTLYPNTLLHNTEYFITVSYKDSYGNYSPESEMMMFNSTGIKLGAPTNIVTYPSVVVNSNPILAIHNELFITTPNGENTILLTELKSIHWTIKNLTTNDEPLKYINKLTTLELPEGTIKENSTYEVEVYYIHNNFGMSPVSTRRFTVNKFVKFLDGLNTAKAINKSMAYFGEVPASSLLPSTYYYRGDFMTGSIYEAYQEVTKDGELYICNRKTPGGDYEFNAYFSSAMTTEGLDLYKSGLPSPDTLLNMIGFGCESKRENPNNSWIKVQNKFGKILYISKLPAATNVSINEMINGNIFHPKRKTIRIHNKLFYVRPLVIKCVQGYDALDIGYPDRDYYKNNALKDTVDYDEDKLLLDLINGTLAKYTEDTIGMDKSAPSEIFYNVDEIRSFRPDRTTGTLSFYSLTIPSPAAEGYIVRPVLEYIPEEEWPINNISPAIPGLNDTSLYNFYMDACYLDYVKNADFVDSEAIDFKTDLVSMLSVPNKGWHKVYYQGLIYFISDGSNLNNIEVSEIVKYNLLRTNKEYITTGDIYLGKLIYNNVVYNVGCPDVLNVYDQKENIERAHSDTGVKANINIFNNTSNYKVDIATNCLFSDVICNIYKKENLGDKKHNGYKGLTRYLERLITISNGYVLINPNLPDTEENRKYLIGINTIGTDDGQQDGTILSSSRVEDGSFVLNYKYKPLNITKQTGGTAEVVFVLSVSPTIDFDKAWK